MIKKYFEWEIMTWESTVLTVNYEKSKQTNSLSIIPGIMWGKFL